MPASRSALALLALLLPTSAAATQGTCATVTIAGDVQMQCDWTTTETVRYEHVVTYPEGIEPVDYYGSTPNVGFAAFPATQALYVDGVLVRESDHGEDANGGPYALHGNQWWGDYYNNNWYWSGGQALYQIGAIAPDYADDFFDDARDLPDDRLSDVYAWSGGWINSYFTHPDGRFCVVDVTAADVASGAVDLAVSVDACREQPAGIGDVALWLSAEEYTDDGTTFQWTDLSGNERHATQSDRYLVPSPTTATMPDGSTAPVLRFSVDDLDYDGSFLAGSDYTVFVVQGRNRGGLANFYLAGGESSPHRNLVLGYERPDLLRQAHYANDLDATVQEYTGTPLWSLDTFRFDQTVGRSIRQDGVLLAQDASLAPLASYVGASVGRFIDFFYEGDIAEILIYDRALDCIEQGAVEAWLGDRWGLSVAASDCDGDGLPDVDDACPTEFPSSDLDADGCEDPDTDGDGVPDLQDVCNGNDAVGDLDGDRTCDELDDDDDGDGVSDGDDCAPRDATAGAYVSVYLDGDGDGYGDAGASVCENATAGYAALGGDCDDADAAVSPGATEVCDSADVDEDCDGVADDADSSVTETTGWYPDADHDGLGAGTAEAYCTPPAFYVANDGDACPTSAPTLDMNGDGCEDLPTVTGGTAILDPDGTVTVHGTGVNSSFGVTFPAGTDFTGGNVAVRAVLYGTVIEVSGVTLPAGQTKSVSLAFPVNRWQGGPWSTGNRRVYNLTSTALACVVDSPTFSAGVASSCNGSDRKGVGYLHRLTQNFTITRGRAVPVDRLNQLYFGYGPASTAREFTSTLPVRASAMATSLTVPNATGRFAWTEQSWTWAPGVSAPIVGLTSATATVSNLAHTQVFVYDDTDGDGLTDYDEVEVLGTDPEAVDSDGDGVSDSAEVTMGSNPTDAASVVDLDADGDGLPADHEAELGTDPDVADSDGDGVGDLEEFLAGTDPTDASDSTWADDDGNGVYDGVQDDDADGLTNDEEARLGTDPLVSDSDGDGVHDLGELLYGTDPTDADDVRVDDTDGDGRLDHDDSCVDVANSDQSDVDGDGTGDACDDTDDRDEDGDDVRDVADPCVGFPNVDADGDGTCDTSDLCPADAADTDADGDLVCDGEDLCVGTSNVDADGDQVCDDRDLCAGNDASGDTDADRVCDANDNCPVDTNEGQADADGDGIGDSCEADSDADGVIDDHDNCAEVFNPDQADDDGDGTGSACDVDDDGDGVPDAADNCPLFPSANQADFDGDGLGDVCDGDDDADGVLDGADLCPSTPLAVPYNAEGCSGRQYVELQVGSCGNYRNKGQYVSAVTRAANAAAAAGLLTPNEKAALTRDAAHLGCR